MTTEQQIAEVKRRCEQGERGGGPLSINRVGIGYAHEVEGDSLSDISETATGHRSYGTENRKGIKNAPFMELK